MFSTQENFAVVYRMNHFSLIEYKVYFEITNKSKHYSGWCRSKIHDRQTDRHEESKTNEHTP